MLTLFILISLVHARSNLLECSFKNSCASNEKEMFAANGNFYQTSPSENKNNVLSSNVKLTSDVNYNRSLCCKINNVNLNSRFDITHESGAEKSCISGIDPIMYFTSSTNARVGFDFDPLFNKSHYSNKLCMNLPKEISKFHIEIDNDSLKKNLGFTCLYKTNSLVNGLISSCDSKYLDNNLNLGEYKYTVWAKLYESLDSLKCNDDCTSKLDGRVYSDCGSKINFCSNVPPSCDGSLYGSWVKLDENNNGVIDSDETTEIQCSAPWSNYRYQVFTDQKLNVNSQKGVCSSLVKKQYSVMYENELINMNIYICED